MVHNHSPEEGKGLDCPETVVDGERKGECLQPGDVIAPGAFKEYEGFKIPVTRKGILCGTAEISPDGEIINVELDSGLLPQVLRAALTEGLISSISIAPTYIPATPKEN